MLDSNGFTRPQYETIVVDLTAKWQELFGSDSDTSAHSVAGVLIRLMAFFLDLIYKLAEKVYNSQYLSTATGVSLDKIASNFGLYRNPAEQAMVDLSFTGTPGFVILAGKMFKTTDGKIYQLGSDVLLSASGTGAGTAYAMETGAQYNVPANAITSQVEPTSDIFTVTNPQAVENGANIETDAELAHRVRLANDTKPSSPVNGVISAVMEVPGVKSVQVVTNNTMAVDSYGNPAKTIHVYVDGGEEMKIADALFNSVSAGILMVGSHTETMTDAAGFSGNVVAFDYATKETIFVTVDVTTNNDFEIDGVDQVKKAVNDYLGSVPMGGTVRFSYLYKYIYDNVNGIVVATVKIGTKADSQAMTDIPLTQFSIATTTADSLVVTKNGN
ncbi:baseplate J/gp47 family protein [Weissella confusa]|uniref:Baseplate J/gp47 family protein n=1 Tax=Weissella confusa TaxID=1583 RepID=A0AA40YLV2_WEICO|nr:baseplate J/gp47 family protein [Weissella confusa]MBJ7637891.1 baseplate J/gp47 family protein [Weissella confusa]